MTAAPNPALPVSVREIIRVVAADYSMTDRVLYGSRRDAAVSEPRSVVCWLAFNITGLSSADIAQVILRDGSTVRHAASVVADRRAAEAAFRARTDRLADEVGRRGYGALLAMLADPDPVAAAERVARNPLHEATRVSTLEIAAMSVRLLELEMLASGVAQLLARENAGPRLAAEGDDAQRAAAFDAGTNDLRASIESTLAALGYITEEEEQEINGEESQDRGTEPARAAE